MGWELFQTVVDHQQQNKPAQNTQAAPFNSQFSAPSFVMNGQTASNMASTQPAQPYTFSTQPLPTGQHSTQLVGPSKLLKPPIAALPPPSISLERYLDLVQLMTKGTSNTVQPLTDLESGALKTTDIKMLCALNGLPAPSKQTKKDFLNRLIGVQLSAPGGNLVTAGAAPQTHNTTEAVQQQQPPVKLDIAALQSLGWCPQAQLAAIASSDTTQQFYSFYKLPHVQLEGNVEAPPAIIDSQVTMASPASLHQQHKLCVDSSFNHTAATVAQGIQNMQQHPQPPQWLLEGIQHIAEESQGSKDYRNPAAGVFVGRKVAFVLLDDFEQHGSNGIIDTISKGVHSGQVVEFIGDEHIEGTCEEDCVGGHTHSFYYVRVAITSSDAPEQTWHRRRLDLIVDMRPEVRVHDLKELCALEESELLDVWVLLEPKEEDDSEVEEDTRGFVTKKENVLMYSKGKRPRGH